MEFDNSVNLLLNSSMASVSDFFILDGVLEGDEKDEKEV